MSRNAMGYALAVMNSITTAEWLDHLGLRKPLEKLTYNGVKNGFKAMNTATRQFKQVTQRNAPVRPDAPAGSKELFDLNLSSEQAMLRDTLEAFARDVIRPAAHDADANAALSDDLLAQVAELGLMFYAVPEAFGGAGDERSPVTQMIIAESLAKGDLGIAAAILTPMGVANALTQWGNAAQQERYLPAFLEEKPLIATMAINEPKALFNPLQLSTTATRNSNGYLLNGEKNLVLLGEKAELFLVAAQLEGKGPSLFLVEANATGISIANGPAMGLKPAATVSLKFENVQLEPNALLGDESFNYQNFLNLCRLGWCSAALGTAAAALEYTITYANERVAFGEPISHRQSVAFMVANIGIELDGMRMMVQRAVARAERGMDFQREAYLARLFCADKAMEIGTNSVQLLGGHGFTKEHPVERWYRDLRAIALVEGNLHL
ncbi:Acyl-CoA dehydrogenase [gamma proteobacterium HdN1]|nr:Acyl-CoA dehydrogenase [gamma proteobacterium HdN1]